MTVCTVPMKCGHPKRIYKLEFLLIVGRVQNEGIILILRNAAKSKWNLRFEQHSSSILFSDWCSMHFPFRSIWVRCHNCESSCCCSFYDTWPEEWIRKNMDFRLFPWTLWWDIIKDIYFPSKSNSVKFLDIIQKLYSEVLMKEVV